MDKRKKNEPNIWVTPGVFSGSSDIEEAVGKINTLKQTESTPGSDDTQYLRDKMEQMNQQITQLQESLEAWELRWQALEEESKRERQYLYQVVLSLKKEWERERHEHRHH
jgi:predicted RNase H-like nuclease (RuvC/YqgF family)